MAVRSTPEVLAQQLKPYLHSALTNPPEAMIEEVKLLQCIICGMLSEQTLGLVDCHVQHVEV